ncbi:MAG: radical SAM protein [Spirochaetes bacterium]|nr:radical SAM protein [Spirochaetota bacterium]
MKALLINPPTGKYMRDDRCQAPVESMTAQPARAPMDLAYMAGMLEQEGLTCRIVDYPMENLKWKDFEEHLNEFDPDYLIISTTTPTLEYDLKSCAVAKHHNQKTVTIAKGAHIVEYSEVILNDYPELDIAIWGEYEFAVKEIVSKDWSEIKGISYRLNDKICRNQERPRLEDLDKLPLPARHLLNNKLYKAPDTGRPIAYILTGRGCPYHCIYCAVSVASGYKLFKRSVESVIREIEDCYYKFNIKDFFFRSDTFTWFEDWVITFCREIINRKLKIRWGTNSRVDTISEERLFWMKKAGCYVIGFGIESGNQEMLDKMKKKITLEQARNAVKLCKKYRIQSYLLFMFGLPWETKESAEDTIRFSKELNGDFADFNIAYPLPGTPFYKMAKEDRLFEGSLTGYDYGNPIIKTYSLSTDELVKIRNRAIREFYFRPSYIIKTILRIRSPRILISYIGKGFNLFMKLIFDGRLH